MKEFGGWWFPNEERHFLDWMQKRNEVVDGRMTYQYYKLSTALTFCKSFRVACDVGGHIGTWGHFLAKRFNALHTFEPVSEFRECYAKNVTGNVTMHQCALGAVSGKVRMVVDPADTGGTHVDSTAEDGNVPLVTLDSFNFENVDFIKIDAEGYERQIVEGAVETLKRCRPCVIVEQKQHKLAANFGIKGTPAVDFLKDLGAVVRKEISGDYICSW